MRSLLLCPSSRAQWPCGDGSKTNELWTVSGNQIKSQQTPPTCLSVSSVGNYYNGTTVTTANCNTADPAQNFTFAGPTGRIVHNPSGMCVDGGSPVPPFNWCEQIGKNWPICDPSAGIDDRSADIVSRISLADKIQALNTATPALTSIGLPSYQCEWRRLLLVRCCCRGAGAKGPARARSALLAHFHPLLSPLTFLSPS